MCTVQFTFESEYGHTHRFPSDPAVPTQWGWQVSRTAHLALERAATEGDGHDWNNANGTDSKHR